MFSFSFGPPQSAPQAIANNDPLQKYLLDLAENKVQLDLEHVKQILRDQENTAVSNESSDALFLAIKEPNIPTKVADLLITKGFHIKGKATRLVEEASVDRIKYALEHLLDLEFTKVYGPNILHHVIKHRTHPYKIPVLELLLKYGVNVNEDPIGLSEDSASFVELNSAKTHPVPSFTLDSTAFHDFDIASSDDVQKKMSEIVEMLVDAGADVNGRPCDSNCTPLEVAIKCGNVDLALLLIEKGAKPSTDGEEIILACQKKFPSIVKLLLERGASPKKLYDDKTLFHFALEKAPGLKEAENEKLTLEIKTLLQHGANFMLSDDHGDNIFHHLARMHHNYVDTFVTLAKFATKDQALHLLSRENSQGRLPRELTTERVKHALFSLDLKIIGRESVDIFKCSKLFEYELESVARGVEYQEFDSSHWNSSADLVQQAAIFALPFETLHAILLMTRVSDIASFSMTCRQFKVLADSDTVWKSIRSREGYGESSTYPSLKKDYVLQRRFNTNMADGYFYVRSVTFDPPALVNLWLLGSLQMVPDCDLAARLVSVTNSLGQVALIDLATVSVLKDMTTSAKAVLESEGTTTVRTNLKQKSFTVVHEREKRELYFRELQQERFIKLRTDCDDIDVEGPRLAYIHNKGNDNFCDVINVENKTKVCHIEGNFNKVVLNGDVVALSNHNNVVELWDTKSNEKIFVSKIGHTGHHVMFKFGNFIVSMGNGIEFIDCHRKVSTQFEHVTSITDTYTIDPPHQVLVTSDTSCSNVLIWKSTSSGDITKEAMHRPRSPLPVPEVYPGAPKSYVLPSLLKLAASKDLVFFAHDQEVNSLISVYRMANPNCLYQIRLAACVRALHLCGPYLFAPLQNGTLAIINFNW